MRYQELLENDFTVIDGNNTMAEIREKCSDAHDYYLSSGVSFFRGITHSSSEFVLWPKAAKHRKAANFGYNYYADIFDHLTSWQGWQPRSQSIIGSSNEGKSSFYTVGNNGMYVVLPVNGATINIVPARDFWDIRIDGMKYDDYIYKIYRDFADERDDGVYMKDGSELMPAIREAGFYDEINQKLSPEALGIKRIKTNQLNQIGTDNELWTSDTCYGVRYGIWNEYVVQQTEDSYE